MRLNLCNEHINRALNKYYEIKHQYKQKRLVEKDFPFLRKYKREYERLHNIISPHYEYYIKEVSTSKMAVSLNTAIILYMFCEALVPKQIIDLGSGFSSFVLRSYASQSGNCMVYSVDDNQDWLDRT